MRIFLFLIFFSATHARSQFHTVDTSNVFFDNGSFGTLIQRVESNRDRFFAFGISIPPISSWSVGYPQAAMEFDLLVYHQINPKLSWTLAGNSDLIMYDIYNYANYFLKEDLSISGQLGISFFPKASTGRHKHKRNFLIMKTGYSSSSVHYRVKKRIPVQRRSGLTVGGFGNNERTSLDITAFTTGIYAGFTRRSLAEVYSDFDDFQGSTYKYFQRIDRVFYALVTTALSVQGTSQSDFRNALLENHRRLPLGFKVGWYFFNTSKFYRIVDRSINLEFAIKSPIFLRNSTGVKEFGLFPLTQFAFRYHFGRHIK